MRNYLKTSLVILGLFIMSPVFAQTATWDLNTSGEYALSDAGKVEVSNGVGRLVRTITPSLLGNFNTAGTTEDMVVSSDGNTAYLADKENGLLIIDISTPGIFLFVGNYLTINSSTQEMVLSSDENTLYIADGVNGLVIVDISTPTSPVLIDNYTDYSVDAVRISSDENTAYLASGLNGLVIVDISNPATPVYVNNYSTSPRTTRTISVSSDENTAYTYLSGLGGGLYILDISDPMDITELGIYNFSASQNMILSADENTIFMSAGANGLYIVDVSDSLDPTLISQYDSAGFVVDISVSSDENIVYLADGAEGITLVDVSDPSTPTFILSFDSSGNARGVDISSDGATAYLADSSDGIDIINLDTTYPTDAPYLTTNTGQAFTSTVTTFTETLGSNSDGYISYQVSTDNGTIWNYWDGAAWATTIATNSTETAFGSSIHTNIATLDTDGGTFKWRAYLTSDGVQPVELDQIDISYFIPPAPEPSTTRSSTRRYNKSETQSLFSKARGEEVITKTTTSSTTTPTTFSGEQCSEELIINQNLKSSTRNGSYNSYTGETVTEAKLLQAHMNRLGFNSGPEDGIIGPLTEGAIKRMQASLGVIADGYVGPITRAAIYRSC